LQIIVTLVVFLFDSSYPSHRLWHPSTTANEL
jgi:hypothetical protein